MHSTEKDTNFVSSKRTTENKTVATIKKTHHLSLKSAIHIKKCNLTEKATIIYLQKANYLKTEITIMKKLFKTLVIALVAIGLTFTANAADDKTNKATFEVGMYRINNTMTMSVFIEKALGKSVVVELKDAKGETLHSETIGKKTVKYSKKWNLENLSDGKYSFVISNGTEKIVKEIGLTTKTPIPADSRTIALY